MFFHGVFLIHKVPSNFCKSYLKRKKELPMNENTNQSCPCCPNHCPSDALQCGKGRAYFQKLPKRISPDRMKETLKMLPTIIPPMPVMRNFGNAMRNSGNAAAEETAVNPSRNTSFPTDSLLPTKNSSSSSSEPVPMHCTIRETANPASCVSFPFCPPEAPSPKDSSWIFWMYAPVP